MPRSHAGHAGHEAPAPTDDEAAHGDPADDGTMFVVARDALGDPVGLLSFVPWGAHGLSLDLMRRSPAAGPTSPRG